MFSSQASHGGSGDMMHDGVIQLTRTVFARKYNIVRKSLKGKQNNKPSPDKNTTSNFRFV